MNWAIANQIDLSDRSEVSAVFGRSRGWGKLLLLYLPLLLPVCCPGGAVTTWIIEPQDSGDGWGSLRSRPPWWFSFLAFNGGFYGLCGGGFTRYNEEPSLLDVF